MSSTQGHTNINTVHTTVDISVLLGEINRIADESYSKGFESGYDVGIKKGRADAIEEIVPMAFEWLMRMDIIDCDGCDYQSECVNRKMNCFEVMAEHYLKQLKEQKNECKNGISKYL